jgi:hypothetical protein
MKLKIHIRRHSDQLVRIYETDMEQPDHPQPGAEDVAPFWPYIWEEGNFRCDCNRHLFFQYAAGVSVQEAMRELYPCGETDYRVLKIEDEGGRVLYADR